MCGETTSPNPTPGSRIAARVSSGQPKSPTATSATTEPFRILKHQRNWGTMDANHRSHDACCGPRHAQGPPCGFERRTKDAEEHREQDEDSENFGQSWPLKHLQGDGADNGPD
jgi:hypothetical protein